MKKFSVLLGSALLLSGCSTIGSDYDYPQLIHPVADSTGGKPGKCNFNSDKDLTRNKQLQSLLNQATQLQCSYANGYRAAAKVEDWSKLPIIALATLAGFVALNTDANLAQKTGKLGVLGLSYSSARDVLNPKDLPKAYLSGYGAINCTLAYGTHFVGKAAERRQTGLIGSIAQNEALVRDLTKLLDETPNGKVTEPQKKNLDAAKTLARQALKTAREVRSPAIADSYAFEEAYPVFLAALSSISVKVATTGRDRGDADYAQLVGAFPSEPNAEALGGAALLEAAFDKDAAIAAPAKDVVTLTNAINSAVEALLVDSNALSASRPRFVETLAKVEKCPDSFSI